MHVLGSEETQGSRYGVRQVDADPQAERAGGLPADDEQRIELPQPEPAVVG